MGLGRSISGAEIGRKASMARGIIFGDLAISTDSTRLGLWQRDWRTKALLPVPKYEGYLATELLLFENWRAK